ncbi:hypothetical protein GCM10010912_17560 [Paenibacillus albidus]|uniref:Uncharacterized protein n=1 Tax=Paenibacillus albidus TaxID=2041023 RepID=A0A917FE66_9BACL|nr:hypothetical protein [Paenibacillus albidus]GGF72859.1 hypothetical protein GCM10010912_17560 [Paenibacillus albidus]
MAFNRRVINKELDMANLNKHNDNYADIETTLDAHDIAVVNSANHIANGNIHTTAAEKTKLAGITTGAGGANSATDAVIGNRTATDSATPSLTGTLTALLSSLFTLVKGITGKPGALTTPAINLEATKAHVDNANLHTTAAEKTKLSGIAAGAEVNQNAFAQVNNIPAAAKTDTLTVTGGTGITVTTNPATKTMTVTATGTATPGAHGSSHNIDGPDPIPDLVAVKAKVEALEDFLAYMPIDGGWFDTPPGGPVIDGGTY